MPKNLTGWNDSVLLLSLVRNRSTPTEALSTAPELILLRLHARDEHKAFEAGVALAQRLDTPENVLMALVDDPRATTEFRKVVARETTHPELRNRLRSDRSEVVRRAAERPAPIRTDLTAGPLAEAYEVIVHDIRSSGAPEPMIFGEDWLREPGRPAAMLRWEGGTGCGLAVWSEWPLTANIVCLADQLQDEIVEQLWRLGRSAVWPECPDHPNSHPLKPFGLNDLPMWICPRTERPIAEIGRLGS